MDRTALLNIDLTEITSTRELHLRLRDDLGLPSWYGCNWDAFWDAITGLVPMPVQVRITGWQTLSQRLPDDARHMQQCLMRMRLHYPELAAEVRFD